MLVLALVKNGEIVLRTRDGVIRLFILRAGTDGGTPRIGIDAPQSVRVDRGQKGHAVRYPAPQPAQATKETP